MQPEPSSDAERNGAAGGGGVLARIVHVVATVHGEDLAGVGRSGLGNVRVVQLVSIPGCTFIGRNG